MFWIHHFQVATEPLDIDRDRDLDVLRDRLLSFSIRLCFSFSCISSSFFCCSLRVFSILSIFPIRCVLLLLTQAMGSGGLVRLWRYVSYVSSSSSAPGDERGAFV